MNVQKLFQNWYLSEPLERILAQLHPYKPSKFILGQYYIKDSMYNLQTQKLDYKGIPIEKSDNIYKIDFELDL